MLNHVLSQKSAFVRNYSPLSNQTNRINTYQKRRVTIVTTLTLALQIYREYFQNIKEAEGMKLATDFKLPLPCSLTPR